ncbi:MAG: IS110 family transposase [Actinomycetales bacterium]|nr:IS110 family transposase [Actinomycetales bacterium]
MRPAEDDGASKGRDHEEEHGCCRDGSGWRRARRICCPPPTEGAPGAGDASWAIWELAQLLPEPTASPSARARVFSTGQGRKTDATDAHSIALVALRTPNLRVVQVDGEHVALRLLADRRDELGVRRTQVVNRIHRLLLELMPGGAKAFLSAPQARALLATVRPRDLAAKTRRTLAKEMIDELGTVDRKIKALNTEIKALVLASGSGLMDLQGIGPSTAARLIGDVGDIARFPTKGHFASWNGTAPIDASSGDNNRHRLSRSGNRRLNRVLHIMAIVQLRNDTEGRRYYDRKKAAGKSSMEALRCLKRRLSDVVYRQMVADAERRPTTLEPPAELMTDSIEVTMKTGPGGHVGATTDSSAAGSYPDASPSEQSLPGPVTTIVATRPRTRKTPLLT